MGRLDYLNQYSARTTVKNYKIALKDFFQVIYGKREPLEPLAEKYFSEERNYEEDIQRFFVFLKNRPPKTIRLKITAVKTFLVENDIELKEKFWRRLSKRIKGTRAVTIDKVPNPKMLRKIIIHMPIQGKALYLTLASSGMRIGEALQLKIEDLELNRNPVLVNIQGEYTKSGNPRVTFISSEAKDAITEWLKVRSEYLRAAAKKSHLYGKDPENPRLFPFETSTAYMIWKNACVKAGCEEKDSRTNRRKFHPHVLRKFFRTRLGAVIPVDIVEALMGHEGYLTEVYRRYSMEDLAKFYREGEHALLIFMETDEVGRLRKEIEEKNKQLQTLVNGLVAENIELKNRLTKMEQEYAEFKTKFNRIDQTIKKFEGFLARSLTGSIKRLKNSKASSPLSID